MKTILKTPTWMCAAIALLALALPSTALSQNKWKQVIDKNGIKVFTRPSEKSQFDEFKGVTTINVDINVIDKVLADTSNATEWMHNCIKSKLLERNEKHVVLYQVTKAPWPVSSRDLIVESIRKEKGNSIVRNMKITTHPKAPPKTNKLVRVPKLKGSWTLTKKGTATHVVYQILMDPGGKLPTWLANSASKDLPFNTLEGLKKIVKKPKYHK